MSVSGHRRRSRDDWLMHMDDTATSDAPVVDSSRMTRPVLVDGVVRIVDYSRMARAMLVDGEVTIVEYDYQPPPRPDWDNIDYLRRRLRQNVEWLRQEYLMFHGRDAKRARGSDDDAIRRCLREARAGDAGMPEDCAVCLQDFDASAKETLRVMPSCSHAFHPNCIFTWLRVKPICPLCRRELPPPQQDDSDEDDDTDSDEEDDDTDSDEDDTDSDQDDTDDQQESTPAVPDPEET